MFTYREKTFICGEYMYKEIYPVDKREVKKKRSEKTKETTKKMKNLNDKNRIKKTTMLANTNFTEKDLFITLSYTDATLPHTEEEAKKRISNFIKRLRRRFKKESLPDLKYISVTERSKKGRVHHHLFISGGLSRDTIEKLWIKTEKGYCNSRRLQADEFGYERLVRYMLKGAVGFKKVSSSRNLKQPKPRINDYKYSKRKAWKLAHSQGGIEIEEENKDYKVTEFKSTVNDLLDVIYISVKMKRRE